MQKPVNLEGGSFKEMILNKRQDFNRIRRTTVIRSEKGFTLLEVIMAISILTIGLLAVASMQASAIRGNAISRDYTKSTDRVQDRAEKLIALSISNVDLTDQDSDGVGGLNDTGANADGSDTSDSKYTVYWNVAEDWAGGNAMTGVNTVRVIVVWDNRGTQASYSFDLMRGRL